MSGYWIKYTTLQLFNDFFSSCSARFQLKPKLFIYHTYQKFTEAYKSGMYSWSLLNFLHSNISMECLLFLVSFIHLYTAILY